MGSFNTACGLTNQVIDSNTEVVIIMLTPNNRYSEMPIHSWSHFAPIPVVLEGLYNSYGGISDVNIFQSKQLFDEEKTNKLKDILFHDLKEKLIADEKNIASTTLDNLFDGRNLFFTSKDSKTVASQQIIKLIKENPQYEKQFKEMLSQFGFKNIKEAEKYIKENENTIEKTPISFMFFKKENFVKFINNYGSNDSDPEHYAPKIQNERNKDLTKTTNKTVTEIMHVVQGSQNYSSANAPRYTYLKLLKNKDKNVSEHDDIVALSKLHALDTTLLNEYFTVLGKTFQPSMYVSEDIRMYGHTEAYAFQQKLLEDAMPAKKMKIK